MRSFGVVDDKLEEADFFLSEIEACEFQMFRVRYLFSAFVSACRSVTFALQASMKDAEGFEEWYRSIQAQLRRDELARFFHDCRTDAQHLGLNPIRGAARVDGKTLHFFGQPEPNRHRFMPEEDMVTACRAYLRTICGIVDRAYEDFGLVIDPDQIFTPDGLRALGQTIEDVEESLGYPRGFTDIPGEWSDKEVQRLSLLRRQIPGSGIKPLLARHLGRELRYPTGPISAA